MFTNNWTAIPWWKMPLLQSPIQNEGQGGEGSTKSGAVRRSERIRVIASSVGGSSSPSDRCYQKLAKVQSSGSHVAHVGDEQLPDVGSFTDTTSPCIDEVKSKKSALLCHVPQRLPRMVLRLLLQLERDKLFPVTMFQNLLQEPSMSLRLRRTLQLCPFR